MTIFDDEMMKALEKDGEYLRQMTGEDHGPYFIYNAECVQCGAPLPSPSDATCDSCLRSAADATTHD
jgi:hypothetical protein